MIHLTDGYACPVHFSPAWMDVAIGNALTAGRPAGNYGFNPDVDMLLLMIYGA